MSEGHAAGGIAERVKGRMRGTMRTAAITTCQESQPSFARELVNYVSSDRGLSLRLVQKEILDSMQYHQASSILWKLLPYVSSDDRSNRTWHLKYKLYAISTENAPLHPAERHTSLNGIDRFYPVNWPHHVPRTGK